MNSIHISYHHKNCTKNSGTILKNYYIFTCTPKTTNNRILMQQFFHSFSDLRCIATQVSNIWILCLYVCYENQFIQLVGEFSSDCWIVRTSFLSELLKNLQLITIYIFLYGKLKYLQLASVFCGSKIFYSGEFYSRSK